MDYAWQRLPAAEAGAVDVHIGGCPECRAILEEERTLCRSLASVPVAKPAHDLWEAIRVRQLAVTMPALPAAHPSVVLSARRNVWRPVTLSLSAGIAVLALMFMPAHQEAQPPVSESPEIAQTLDQARTVSQQSDNPLREVSDTTWDTLSDNVNVKDASS
jgi:anti-sigma factor RsiW